MKPNFEQMSVPELRAYVLGHRDDIEAIRALFHHPSLKWKTMPPLVTQDGLPIEENIRIAEEAIRQRAEVDRENDQYTHQTMTTVTPQEIAKFRAELADYPEALEALDVIEECDYNLEDAAEVLADTEAVRKGGSKKPDVNLLDELAEQLRDVICKDEFRNGMLNDSVNVAVGVLLASSTVNPAVLVIPAFMYVMRKGINKFCDTSKVQ
jgi:hypothetical protein